jgi:hypothetical protein
VAAVTNLKGGRESFLEDRDVASGGVLQP